MDRAITVAAAWLNGEHPEFETTALFNRLDVLNLMAEYVEAKNPTGPDHKVMVTEIAEVASDVLDEWECHFIEDMTGKTTFTDRQQGKIETIYEKVCAL